VIRFARLHVLGANALVLLGVTLCATAGKIREGPSTRSTSSQKRTSQGLLLSILCGLLASFMNFAVAFGTPLAQVARFFGANGINSMRFGCRSCFPASFRMSCSARLMKRNGSGHSNSIVSRASGSELKKFVEVGPSYAVADCAGGHKLRTAPAA
jgi:hypothetical protein